MASSAVSPADACAAAPAAAAAASAPFAASVHSSRAVNPLRRIVEGLRPPAGHPARLLSLTLGDPAAYGAFPPPAALRRAVAAAALARPLPAAAGALEGPPDAALVADGYAHSQGGARARAAAAAWMGVARPAGAPRALGWADVTLASGCSGALDLAMAALADEGDVVLLPRPGFSLYAALAAARGVRVRYYDLAAADGWALPAARAAAVVASLVCPRTRCLVMCNPSNPCGSVWPAAAVEALVRACEAARLPVVSDEIYGRLVFPSSPHAFVSPATYARTVPVLAAGGTAKEFLVPGWRMGWLAVHDAPALGCDATPLRDGIAALAQMTLGPCTLLQAALPAVLTPAPGSADAAELAAFHADTCARLQEHADVFARRLAAAPGIAVVPPLGAMYLMLELAPGAFNDGAPDDVAFAQALLAEENVAVFPGSAFGGHGYVRVVTCAPLDMLAEAADRIAAFCTRKAAAVAEAARAGGRS